eukprot:18023-Heterococcus_DN1.PRE.4
MSQYPLLRLLHSNITNNDSLCHDCTAIPSAMPTLQRCSVPVCYSHEMLSTCSYGPCCVLEQQQQQQWQHRIVLHVCVKQDELDYNTVAAHCRFHTCTATVSDSYFVHSNTVAHKHSKGIMQCHGVLAVRSTDSTTFTAISTTMNSNPVAYLLDVLVYGAALLCYITVTTKHWLETPSCFVRIRSMISECAQADTVSLTTTVSPMHYVCRGALDSTIGSSTVVRSHCRRVH